MKECNDRCYGWSLLHTYGRSYIQEEKEIERPEHVNVYQHMSSIIPLAWRHIKTIGNMVGEYNTAMKGGNELHHTINAIGNTTTELYNMQWKQIW